MWKGFQKPKRLATELESLTDKFGKFSAQPFVRRSRALSAGRRGIDTLGLGNLDASHPRFGDRGADTRDGNGRQYTLDHLGLPVPGG